MKKAILAWTNSNILLLALILLSLMIRLVLINIPSFHIDMDAWIAWAYRLSSLGTAEFYSPTVWTNYTPGYLYQLYIFGIISTLFSLTSQNLETLIKLVSIIFEIGLVLFIYFSQNNFSQRNKIILSIFLLFNPAFIFNSTIWGQIDGILTFFMFISIYYLDHNQTKSSLSYAYAFLIKPQAIALAPIYLIEVLKKPFNKSNLKLIIPGTILFLVLSLPFFPSNPLFGIFQLVFQMSQDYPATSLFAYNLWGNVGFWIDDQNQTGLLNYRTIGTIIFITSIALTIYLGLKKKANYFLLAALLTLFFYFLPTRVHERYLYPALPFLFYIAVLFRHKIIFILSTILSITYTLNLYYVYVYYNELFNQTSPKVLYYQPLYSFLDSHGKLLSLFSTLIFSMIVWNIVKIIYAKKADQKPH